MFATYSVCGLRIRSNLPLPGLAAVPYSTPTDLTVTFGASLDCPVSDERVYHVGHHLNERCEPKSIVWRSGSGFRIVFSDGVKFLLDAEGSTVKVAYPASLTLEYVTTYLVGLVLGFVLRLKQFLCLHAAAIVIENRAVALLGAHGAGKSTTAAAFSKLGYSVLSDDITCLVHNGDTSMVQPGYPRVNLWSDSVQLLYGASDALPQIALDWDKRYLDLGQDGGRFCSTAMPLAAIYVLGRDSDAGSVLLVERVSGQQAVLALVGNTYMNLLLDKGMRAYEFDAIYRLLADVPVRRVIRHTASEHPYAVCERIISDLKSIGRA